MTDPTKEQNQPSPSDGDVWLLVMRDMESRRRKGIVKYGVPVQPNNGRDALVDAYQEALDLCVYLRQAIEEREMKNRQCEQSSMHRHCVRCHGAGAILSPSWMICPECVGKGL